MAVAVVEVAEPRAAQVEHPERRIAARLPQVHEQRTTAADDVDASAADDGGAVLLDAKPEAIPLGEHQRQHAADATALEEVLVDEQLVADEAQAAVDLLALAQGTAHHLHDVERVAEHHAAHDRRAGAGAGHDAATPVDVPDGIEHLGPLAVGLERVDDEALRAAGEKDRVGDADPGDQFGIVQVLLQVDAFETRRDGDVLGLGAVALERVDDEPRGEFRVGGGGGEHGEARLSRAAGLVDDALPDGIVVHAQRPADDDGGLRACDRGEAQHSQRQRGQEPARQAMEQRQERAKRTHAANLAQPRDDLNQLLPGTGDRGRGIAFGAGLCYMAGAAMASFDAVVVPPMPLPRIPTPIGRGEAGPVTTR